jgi:hypothetical protein
MPGDRDRLTISGAAVRIASPPDVTGRLLKILTADSGVLNLVVLKGAAQRPDGDALQFVGPDLSSGRLLRFRASVMATVLSASQRLIRLARGRPAGIPLGG